MRKYPPWAPYAPAATAEAPDRAAIFWTTTDGVMFLSCVSVWQAEDHVHGAFNVILLAPTSELETALAWGDGKLTYKFSKCIYIKLNTFK